MTAWVWVILGAHYGGRDHKEGLYHTQADLAVHFHKIEFNLL